MPQMLICVLLSFAVSPAVAQIQPLEVAIGEMVEGVACASDPTQTYTLYIPSAYEGGRRYPVLLVFDPRGRSLLAADIFRDAAERYGWIIVSSDNTRSDESWDPNFAAIKALWPEIHTRIPTEPRRIYATGFSGGAAVATLLARSTGEVAGVIACGGLHEPNEVDDDGLPVFSATGDTDFNYLEMHALNDALTDRGNPHRLVIFEGAHTWMPPAVAREAVEWMEVLAMKAGTRDRDVELVAKLYAADLERARSMVATGDLVAAERRFRQVGDTYEDLCDVSEARAQARAIFANDAYTVELKEAKRATDYEEGCQERRSTGLSMLRNADVPPPVAQLEGHLHLRELRRNSGRSDAKGLAAQRCLNSMYAALSFYLPREEMARRRYAQVAASYELANLIRDDNPVVWYNLACARASLGQKSAAVEALEAALDRGFNRFDLLRTDSDLDPLRTRNDFKMLMGSLPTR